MSAQGEATFATVEGVERGVRYTGTIQDITERKRAEVRLQRSETRLRLAMEAGRLGVWDYDLATDTVRGSPDLNRILGFPDDRPLDIDEIRSRYLPGEQERMRAASEAALKSGETYFQVEFRFRRPDESVRWLQLRAEMILDGQGRPQSALGVLMDMTERKQAEEDRQFLVSELQHRTKNILSLVRAIAVQTFRKEGEADAVGVFTSRLVAMGAAHELPHQDNSEFDRYRRHRSSSAQAASCRRRPFADRRPACPPVAAPGHVAVAGAERTHHQRNQVRRAVASTAAVSKSAGRARLPPRAMRTLRFSWKEFGGPRVTAPSRRGFGTRLIEDHMAAEFGGTAALIYPATGLEFVLTAPWPQ